MCLLPVVDLCNAYLYVHIMYLVMLYENRSYLLQFIIEGKIESRKCLDRKKLFCLKNVCNWTNLEFEDLIGTVKKTATICVRGIPTCLRRHHNFKNIVPNITALYGIALLTKYSQNIVEIYLFLFLRFPGQFLMIILHIVRQHIMHFCILCLKGEQVFFLCLFCIFCTVA